jgi:hypothetical protein
LVNKSALNRFWLQGTFKSRALWSVRAGKGLREFVQVAFFDDLDAENNFAIPFDTLKHCFIHITGRFLDIQVTG